MPKRIPELSARKIASLHGDGRYAVGGVVGLYRPGGRCCSCRLIITVRLYQDECEERRFEELGVRGEQLIKRVLGHADGIVTAIYNRYGYVKEMRSVLEHWAKDLTASEAKGAALRQKVPESARVGDVEEVVPTEMVRGSINRSLPLPLTSGHAPKVQFDMSGND